MNREDIIRITKECMKLCPARPEKKVGKSWITNEIYPPGKELLVVDARNSFFLGLPVTRLSLEEPYTYCKLHTDDVGIWMTNDLREIFQMAYLLFEADGHCLVGGLGLGYAANMLVNIQGVDSVTVVENDKDIIELVQWELPSKVEIIHEDLLEYVKKDIGHLYNYAFLDIWQGTGEFVWLEQVVPLKRAIGKKIDLVRCWQEDVMQGQIIDACFRQIELDDSCFNSIGQIHYYTFKKFCEKNGFHSLNIKSSEFKDGFIKIVQKEYENKQDTALQDLMRKFLQVGTRSWEEEIGTIWDGYAAKFQ